MAFQIAEGFVRIRADRSQLNRDVNAMGATLQNKLAEIGKIAGGMLTANLVGKASQMFAGLGQSAVEFEQQMARVKALTQTTGAEFARLESLASELGRTTSFTGGQAAMAMSNLAQAGFSVNEIMTAVPNALNLAAAGQIDLASAADITAKVMRGMGLQAEELGHTVNLMTQAMITSNTDLTQLGEAMKFVGPVARTAGKGIEEVVAAIQVMSNAGLQGSIAGTSLRNILTRLAGGSSESRKVFEQLGLTMTTATGQMKPLAQIVDELRVAMAGLGESERTAALMQAFGQRGGPGMASLLEEGGDALRDFQSKLENVGDVAQQIAETQMDTTRGSFLEFRSAIEGVAQELSKPIFAPLTAALDAVRNIITLNDSAIVRYAASLAAGVAAVKAINLAFRSFVAIQKAAASASAVTMALAGPKGWAQLGVGIAAATGALWALDSAFGSIEQSADEAVEKSSELPEEIKKVTTEANALRQSMAGLGELGERFTRFGDVFRDALAVPGESFSMDDANRELDQVQAKLAQLEIAGADIGRTDAARGLVDQIRDEAARLDEQLFFIRTREKAGVTSPEDATAERNAAMERFNSLVQEGATLLDELGVETGLDITADQLRNVAAMFEKFNVSLEDPRPQFEAAMKQLDQAVRAGVVTAEEAAKVRIKAELELDEQLGGGLSFIRDLEDQLAGLGKNENERILERLLGNPDVAADQIDRIKGLLDDIDQKKKELELEDIGKQIAESTMTADERFERSKQQLLDVFQAGLLPGGEETFTRQLAALEEQRAREKGMQDTFRAPFMGGLQQFSQQLQTGLQTDDQMRKMAEKRTKFSEQAAKTLAEINDKMDNGGTNVATVGEG